MEIQSYNAELALANLMFLRIFNNIRIDRSDKNGNTSQIKVNCTFGKRSRVLKNLENPDKKATLKFPMLVINRTGYARNPDRLNNMHNEVKFEVSSKNRNYNLLTPIPIDISYDVCIISKYPSDIDQIASNFMVFFNSDVYVSCMHPKYYGLKLNNQIIMQDSITEEHNDELDSSADDFITTTFQFTFKTYLFGGKVQAKPRPKYILSSELSTYTKRTVSAIEYNELSNIKDITPYSTVSIAFDEIVTEEVSTYVPTNISDDIYDDIVPIIEGINVGFYAIPQICADYATAMNDIDNMTESIPFVDRLYWKIDDASQNVFPYNVVQM